MNYTKVFFLLLVISVCCITLGASVKCYTCGNSKDCKKPKTNECNPSLANSTNVYLEAHHKATVRNITSQYFECYTERISFSGGEVRYKGCIYSNVRGCALQLNDYYTQGKHDRTCNQCTKEKCNPAPRAKLTLMTAFGTLLMAVIAKYL